MLENCAEAGCYRKGTAVRSVTILLLPGGSDNAGSAERTASIVENEDF